MSYIKLRRPVAAEFRISSPFARRVIDGKEEFHNGYDFAVPVGTPVYACADGAAFRCGWQDDQDRKIGYGLRLMQEIEQLDGIMKKRFYVWYGHLSKLAVKEGDRILAGQLIGYSGNTGRSTGPHCHVGCREKDTSNFMEIEWEAWA